MNLLGTRPVPETGSADLGRWTLRDVFPGRQERPQRWLWRFVHRTDALWTCGLQHRSSHTFWWCVVYLTTDAMPSTAHDRVIEEPVGSEYAGGIGVDQKPIRPDLRGFIRAQT